MRPGRFVVCLILLLAAALACNTPGASALTEIPPTAQVIVVTATPPAATAGPVVRATIPTAPPTAVPPRISANIIFAESPDAASGARSFHAGVTRIYALLQYFNMSEQLLVRRDWYLDGKLWLSKSDRWSVAKYGRDGTLKDISIYDTQNGLPSGHYELRVFIDDVPQFGPLDDIALRSFDIAKPGAGGT